MNLKSLIGTRKLANFNAFITLLREGVLKTFSAARFTGRLALYVWIGGI